MGEKKRKGKKRKGKEKIKGKERASKVPLDKFLATPMYFQF